MSEPAPKKARTGDAQPNQAGAGIATKRIMAELSRIRRGDHCKGADSFTDCGPVDESDIFVWEVTLTGFDHPEADANAKKFGSDLKSIGAPGVVLGIRFPTEYPRVPPFVWVKKPGMHAPYLFGKGGMCLQILSDEHWSPAVSVPNLLSSIRSMWNSRDVMLPGMVNKLQLWSTDVPYSKQVGNSEQDARDDFNVVKRAHSDWFVAQK
tara:strand:+ start:5366 stop:5989 length:624 start_codon:yes stop_codon:yes gene_type:complete